MAELFGAPLGIIAKESGNQRELQTGLTALKTIGEIEMQPVDAAYKASLTKLHAADAVVKNQEAVASATLSKLNSDWVEHEAREKLAAGVALKEGRPATIADVPPNGASKPWSAADKLSRFAQFVEKSGVSPALIPKLYESIATIREKESQAAHHDAQQRERDDKVRRDKLAELGGAAAAAASSPQNYAQAIMSGKLPPEVLKNLTGNFKADQPVLQYLAASSRTAEQLADQARKEQELKLSGARVVVAQTKAQAYVKAVEARVAKSKFDLDLLEKTAGPKSQAYLDKLNTTSEAQRELKVARELRNYPPVPLKVDDRELGRIYTGKSGQRARWEGVDADGKPIWSDPLKAAQATIKASESPIDPPPGDE